MAKAKKHSARPVNDDDYVKVPKRWLWEIVRAVAYVGGSQLAPELWSVLFG